MIAVISIIFIIIMCVAFGIAIGLAINNEERKYKKDE